MFVKILDQLRNRRRTGPEGQLRGFGARVDGSSARKKKVREHLGSVEKPKAHGSGRTAKGFGACVYGSSARKKKDMDTLDKLKNRRHMGLKGQLRGIGIHLGSASKEKARSTGPTGLAKAQNQAHPNWS
ncbi:unnamed protein product [Prunus armeniaca]